MAVHTLTLIPGDGTGPEIVEATIRAIEATGVQITWDRHEIGVPAIEKYGTPFPQAALDSIKRNKGTSTWSSSARTSRTSMPVSSSTSGPRSSPRSAR